MFKGPVSDILSYPTLKDINARHNNTQLKPLSDQ